MNIPFLTRNNLVVGLDIGSHSVKVCQLKKSGSGFVVTALGSALLPEGVVDDGTLNEPEIVGKIIANLLKNLKITNKKIGFSISGYSVIVKKINIEAMGDALLEAHIMAEAEQYIPFDIDDVYLDFQDLKTNTDSNSRTDVMLVAAKRQIVQDYLDMFTGLKLTPVLVDIDGFALANAFEHAQPENRTIALVDIGATQMGINILSNGLSVVARDVVLGSQQLTEQIQDLLDIEIEEAEQIKLGIKTREENQKDLENIFSSVCTQWVLEIKKAIDLYHANHPDTPLQKLVLSGGGSKVKGLDEFLANETGLEVEIFSPFAGMQTDKKKIDPEYLAKVGPEMAIAAGIALRESAI